MSRSPGKAYPDGGGNVTDRWVARIGAIPNVICVERFAGMGGV